MNIDVSINDRLLTISGEKSESSEQKDEPPSTKARRIEVKSADSRRPAKHVPVAAS